MSDFVHLHLHSGYSLENSLIHIDDLIERSAAIGCKAVAITDECNLFSIVKFYKAAKSAGIKPIIGADLQVYNEQEKTLSRLVLLCQNQQGYKNLTRLVSKCYTEGYYKNKPTLRSEWLESSTDGLLALSGGVKGDIWQALEKKDAQLAEQRLQRWQHLFPDRFYLEVIRTGRVPEEQWLHKAVELAIQYDLPIVASNDVYFLDSDDFDAHEARVCISSSRVLDDSRRPRDFSNQQYLRTPKEMQELFSDLPEALENSVEISKRCTIELSLGKNYLPQFPIPDGLSDDDYLKQQAREGLQERFKKLEITEQEEQQKYLDRLELELNVICQMGFPGYFLIVAEFIQWALENKVPVGPGRGSGAGSLVAYSLKITDLDPLAYDLLFERFLNPERISMPDFDIDFCTDGRDRVIEHVAELYGKESVSQIITYGRMTAKSVVRDVGRVLGMPYGFVDRVAKMIPDDMKMTIDKALKEADDLQTLYREDDAVHDLIEMGKRLEGLPRNAGKHAGGVVISPSLLTDFTPLYCEEGEDSSLVTQFDMKDVESVGLVKFDFLGLRTLTIIDWALEGLDIDISKIPLDDEKTYDLLKACQTTAIFQLESSGMKDLINRLQPDTFEDIVALVALFRPGPLESGMVDNFIERKHGREKVSYPDKDYQHDSLQPVLEPTYGIILYQEQVMKISQVLAGYSLGDADLLRRAMGKKIPEEMAKQRSVFEEGAAKNNIDPDLAMKIFDLVEKFAGYGFNKSHSAAYALLAYQTAWLKTHYPAQFMAAVLSSDIDKTEKVVMMLDECKAMGLEVLPPDVNYSNYKFRAGTDKQIIYGLGAIKGVGEGAIELIVSNREKEGNYHDLYDLCRKVDTGKVNRRVLEALISSGSMDSIAPEMVGGHIFSARSKLMASLDKALAAAEQYNRDLSAGQGDLFGGVVAKTSTKIEYAESDVWSDKQRLQGEKATLGIYLTGHPIEAYLSEIEKFSSSKISQLKPNGSKIVVITGLLVGLRIINTRRGKMAIVSIEDSSNSQDKVDVTLYSDIYENNKEKLGQDNIVVVEGLVETDDYSGGVRIVADKLYTFAEARELFAKRLTITIDSKFADIQPLSKLHTALSNFNGGQLPVVINYCHESGSVNIALGKEWSVTPEDELLQMVECSVAY